MSDPESRDSDSTNSNWVVDSSNNNNYEDESSSEWEDSNENNVSSNDASSSIGHNSSEDGPASEAEESEPTTDECKKKRKKKHKNSSTASTSTEDEPNVDTVSSDANSTTDESTEASTSHSDKTSTSGQTSNGTNEWTISEDGLLRGMKTGGATWAEIADALRIRKKECQSRWKVIKDQPPSTPGAKTTDPDTTEPETTEPDTTEPETSESGGTEAAATISTDHNQVSSAQDDDEAEDTSEQADGDDTGIKKKTKKGKEPAMSIKKKAKKKITETKSGNVKKAKAVDNKWHKGTKNTKVADGNKKSKSHTAKAQKEDLSGEEASSETSSTPTTSGSSSSALTDVGYGNEEWRHEMRYLQDHVYTSLYPQEIHPEPDAHFSSRDCRLLGLIDSRQKRNRWLEMQANFYNVTGRMVPLELIRDKCERAEAAGRDECDGNSGGKRSCIEKWVHQVSQEDLEDPET